MSDVVNTAATEPTPAPNGDTPTITHFQQLAANLKAAIAAVMAEIPKFEIANGDQARSVRAHLWVPPEFIASVISQLDPTEAGFNVLDPADMQNVLQAARQRCGGAREGPRLHGQGSIRAHRQNRAGCVRDRTTSRAQRGWGHEAQGAEHAPCSRPHPRAREEAGSA